MKLRTACQICLGFIIASCAVNHVAADGGLVQPGAAWRYLRGLSEPHPDWIQPFYDDSAWPVGPSGFSVGFGNYEEATVLHGLPGSHTAVYLRQLFVVTSASQIIWPMLRIDYDDGFVAYLNGSEIARRGLPGGPGTAVAFDAVATPHARGATEEIDLRLFKSLIVTGTNLLALQVHNSHLTNPTLAVVPELWSGITRGPFLQSTSSNRTLVVWKTAIPSDSRVEYGVSPGLEQTVFDLAYTTTHVLELTNLTPDTGYTYRVTSSAGAETVRSDAHTFRTLKHGGSARFLVVGDTGVGQPAQYDVARQMDQRGGDLVLHLGDIVYPQFITGRVDAKLFGIYPQMASQPWFFALGNHDLYIDEWHYLSTFHLPTNSPSGGERYYSFDHGDIHFVVLMVPYLSQYKMTVGDPQHSWLTSDLAATTKPWKVLIYHVPMQTSALHRLDDWNLNGLRDSEEIRQVLLPIAAQYGVQVTFSGHDHVFERFAPTNHVHTITTGGGGVGLYNFVERDAGSVQFWSIHHFTEVAVTGDRMEITAIDRFGNVFDSQVIHRTPAADVIHAAAWHAPVLESAPPNDGDGNLAGQRYDFAGEPMPALPGDFASLGEVRVNNDKTRLYIGIDRSLLRDDSVVYMFIESPRLPGVSSLAGLGNGMVDPGGQGVDGLDLLENLAFDRFTPAVGLILGDELADTTFRSWQRPGQSLNTGQGAFRLNGSLDEIGAQIQQFNRSPQTGSVALEQNADFIEISIPYSGLGGLRPGDVIKLGAVIAGNGHDVTAQRQRLDTAFLGSAMTGSGTNDVTLAGVRVQLAADPDRDGDGLPNAWELAHNLNPDSAIGDDGAGGNPDNDRADNLHEFLAGTNPRDAGSVFEMWLSPVGASALEIRWRTEPGLRYQLESATNGSVGFAPLGGLYFPRPGTGSEDAYTNETTAGSQLFRLRQVN